MALADRESPFARWWVEEPFPPPRARRSVRRRLCVRFSPFETAEAAARIAQEPRALGRPPTRSWALDEWTVYRRSSSAPRRRRMRRDLGCADRIVLNTAEAGRATSAMFPELASRIEIIPNGWDADDFAGAPPARDDTAYRIVYVGYSHHESGRRHRRLRLSARDSEARRGLDVLSGRTCTCSRPSSGLSRREGSWLTGSRCTSRARRRATAREPPGCDTMATSRTRTPSPSCARPTCSFSRCTTCLQGDAPAPCRGRRTRSRVGPSDPRRLA